MPTSPWNVALPLPLAIAIMIGCIARAGHLVRANDRRGRRRARGEVARLREALDRFLAEASDPADLDRVARRASPGAFWNALESCAPRLRYVHWLRLSRALEANPFSVLERRALREESPWRRMLAAKRLGLLRSERSRRALRRALVAGP